MPDDSDTETFVAARMYVDTERWRDVPEPAAAEQEAIVNAGTHNVTGGTAANALTGGIFPGAGATGVTAFNAATLNPAGTSFFVQTSYIGAVSGASDTWFRGWTCNSNRANFGTASSACTGLPS